jgi:glycosyltransferase involved in cell wall biosynthesis
VRRVSKWQQNLGLAIVFQDHTGVASQDASAIGLIPMRRLLTLANSGFKIVKDDGYIAFLEKFKSSFEERAYRLLQRSRKIVYDKKQQQAWPRERPLVSIIIPCYNYGEFVRGAIESVIAQTFQRFEILVIDDGSTDGLTKQVLHDLSYEKTRVIHQCNQGLAQTRNNGAAIAAGKYICFLDADDLIEPTYLEKTLHILESDESVGSCYSWVRCFGDYEAIWKTEDLDPFFLKKRNTSSSHSVIRKEAWERVKESNGSGFLSEYNGYFEDWVFWIEMVQCGYRGVAIREPLIRYRVHDKSLGATHKPGFDKMLEVLHENKRDFFRNRTVSKQLEKYLSRRILMENSLINLSSPSDWIK